MGRRKIRAVSRADCRTGRPEPRRDGDRRHPRHSRGKKSSDLGAAGQPVAVRVAEDLDAAFATLVKDKPKALIILADRIFLHNRARLIDFATQNRLPGVYAYRELVEAGGLMSYGPSYEDLHRRAATYVDKILKGAKPADLPIEQPTKFTLIVNLRSARVLGLTMTPTLLGRADEVIESG